MNAERDLSSNAKGNQSRLRRLVIKDPDKQPAYLKEVSDSHEPIRTLQYGLCALL